MYFELQNLVILLNNDDPFPVLVNWGIPFLQKCHPFRIDWVDKLTP